LIKSFSVKTGAFHKTEVNLPTFVLTGSTLETVYFAYLIN